MNVGLVGLSDRYRAVWVQQVGTMLFDSDGLVSASDGEGGLVQIPGSKELLEEQLESNSQ